MLMKCCPSCSLYANQHNVSPLISAIALDHALCLQCAIVTHEKSPLDLIHSREHLGWTLMHVAVYYNRPDAVKCLIEIEEGLRGDKSSILKAMVHVDTTSSGVRVRGLYTPIGLLHAMPYASKEERERATSITRMFKAHLLRLLQSSAYS